jgi:hypothetical protein
MEAANMFDLCSFDTLIRVKGKGKVVAVLK